MEKVIFEGKAYTPQPTDKIEIEDVVMVNDVVGWIDFIGQYVIAIVDESNTTHKVGFVDMKEVFMLGNAFMPQEDGGHTYFTGLTDWRDAKREILREEVTKENI